MINAIFLKEWTLLWRDKVGLIFLFILPMCLILFMTLTTSEEATGTHHLKLILVNQDVDGKISQEFVSALKKIKNFIITQPSKKDFLNFKSLKEGVADSDYQAMVIIPNHFSQQILSQIQKQVSGRPINLGNQLSIQLLFDPTLPKHIQTQIKSGIQLLSTTLELKLWQSIVSPNKQHGIDLKDSPNAIPIKTKYLKNSEDTSITAQPNDVQQNVPAWALFGMFFIITPLSGVIVKERQLGVVSRLYLAPIPFFSLIWGRVCAFVSINMLQLILMLAVGVFILPWFGLPTLNVGSNPGLILVVGLSASFAATGFGMLIGSLVKTPEQANVIGPFIIVIAAAIGGIFMPAYLLPDAFRRLTDLSPMNWALQAFIDILVRNATVAQILPNLLKLLLFALLTISISVIIVRCQRQ